MLKLKTYINKMTLSKKVTYLTLIIAFVLICTIGIPSLARFKNRNTIVTVPVWDGSVASSYHKGTGTENDPYIIANGAELAYFSQQLIDNDYADTYFALSNDIVLNKGIFSYTDDEGIKYTLNDTTYYVANYSNKYYDNSEKTGTEVGTINIFESLNGFKGHFDGNSFTIYGLYVTNEKNREVALFTNLQGSVKDLYVDNAAIYGGIITGGIASTTNGATVTNVLMNGFVVGKTDDVTQTVNIVPIVDTININSNQTVDYMDFTNNIPFVGGEILTTTVTGNYTINGVEEADTTITINGQTVAGGSFEIDLGTSIAEFLRITTITNSENEGTLTFSDLSYNITYKYGVAGGIVALANNTTIENNINKADIRSYSVGGGLIGTATSLIDIKQSYNNGNVNSEAISGGLIGVIERSNQNNFITACYNTGIIAATNFGGLIGVMENNSGTITISNVFDASTTDYSIGTVTDSTVKLNNGYHVNGLTAVNDGTIDGEFVLISNSDLESKDYIINNLLFKEFITFDNLITNSDSVWIFEDSSLPILFIDDIKNPLANIKANVYTWNNFSVNLNPIKLDSNITFHIEAVDVLKPLKEIYYYVSELEQALTKEEVEQISNWNTYNSIVQITEEGTYVIYAKVVDYNDNVAYLNSDLLILDLPGADINVTMDDYVWTDLRDNLNYAYINQPKTITIEANNEISGISSIKYYVADTILSKNNLDALNENNWLTYDDGILIDEFGTYVIYARIIDNYNYSTYINTDYLIYSGYTQNDLIIGRNANSYEGSDPYITDKSTVTINTNYEISNVDELTNTTHNLITTILLPRDTKITLIDNVMNKVYEYLIEDNIDHYNYNASCDLEDIACVKVATYPFTLFKEIGADNKAYIENTYYENGTITEDFTVIIDFSNTNISNNYNDVALYLELHDSNGKVVRPTLSNTIKKLNIYSTVNDESSKASLYLSSDYNGNTILLNSDSTTDVNITSKIDYKYINEYKIIDTSYEDKEIGLLMKIVDHNGQIVAREYLKNLAFKIGDDTYYVGKDNMVRISLKNGFADIDTVLTIITSDSADNNIAAGTYYLKITNYASYDGYYTDELGDMELSVPLEATDERIINEYGFNVTMDEAYRIIDKTNEEVNVTFDISQSGTLMSPNIKVALYKKDSLTAYDQKYSMVNLADYITNSLVRYSGNIYNAINNPNEISTFELNFVTGNFENNGYKLVFYLYDGTKKIGTIEKYFIVK